MEFSCLDFYYNVNDFYSYPIYNYYNCIIFEVDHLIYKDCLLYEDYLIYEHFYLQDLSNHFIEIEAVVGLNNEVYFVGKFNKEFANFFSIYSSSFSYYLNLPELLLFLDNADYELDMSFGNIL